MANYMKRDHPVLVSVDARQSIFEITNTNCRWPSVRCHCAVLQEAISYSLLSTSRKPLSPRSMQNFFGPAQISRCALYSIQF